MVKTASTRAEHWLEEGLSLLRELGEDALTIERLCENLKRTKGSFYHHFKDLSTYLDALLLRWEKRDTEAVILKADTGVDVKKRREQLEAAVRHVDTRLDVAVRAWGLRSGRAREVVGRVDYRRINYLAELYEAQGLSADDALSLARLEYAAFIGAEQLCDTLPGLTRLDLERTLQLALQATSARLRAKRSTSRS